MAEKKGEFTPSMPTAPPDMLRNAEFLHHRGPPPSYEQSQKADHRPPAPPNYFASVNSAPQTQMIHHQYNSAYPYPMTGGATGSIGVQHLSNIGMQHPPNIAMQKAQGSIPVIEYDACARFKGKGAGSLTVPPPPPGYAPTPAQLAALQGQPVILKKKKNSFY